MTIEMNTRLGVNETSAVSAPTTDALSVSSLKTPAPVLPDVRVETEASLPQLSAPARSLSFADLKGWAGVPSLGATLLALTVQIADQDRRAAGDQRTLQTKYVAQGLREEAGKIRSQAVSNLVMGLVSSAVTIAASGFQAVASGKALATLEGDALAARTQQIKAYSDALSGLGNTLNTVKEFVSAGFDADIKKKEAEIEVMRAHADQLDSLTDAMKQVIQKAIAAQEAIMESSNQTRTKILS